MSIVGALGLGYFALWYLDRYVEGIGIVIPLVLMLFLAVAKIYLDHVVTGARFWPGRRNKSN